MDSESGKPCPRCDASRLRGWNELNDEEREVVKRLPNATDYSIEVRMNHHRWCPRCWYEGSGVTSVDT